MQSQFVDYATRAVRDGDAVVAEVMQTLAALFAPHKADLEGQWNTGDVPTHDLPQAFQRYRAFFQRLLSAGRCQLHTPLTSASYPPHLFSPGVGRPINDRL